MKYKTYLKNRQLFESRYDIEKYGDCGFMKIKLMNKGIRNFDIFFKLYSRDRRFHLSQCVSSIDRDKRYRTLDGRSGTRISITSMTHSMYEKFSDEYARMLRYLHIITKTNLTTK